MNTEVAAIRTGIRVEWLTIGWMVVEAAVSIGAGIAAGSIALIAFGVDSVIELVSAGTLLWRLRLEDAGAAPPALIERAERQASRVVGVSLLLLAAYVVLQSGYDLWTRAAPERSLPGIDGPRRRRGPRVGDWRPTYWSRPLSFSHWVATAGMSLWSTWIATPSFVSSSVVSFAVTASRSAWKPALSPTFAR